MHIEYSVTINRDDWHDVLTHAGLANVFHTPEYFDLQVQVGHSLVYMCCYGQGKPIGIITGYKNTFGYHQGLIEIGTKSGGYPLMIEQYDQTPEASQIKNAFIEYFAHQCLHGQRFFFYPCFHLQACTLEDPVWGCLKQYDATAFLNLQLDEATLWKNLGDKGRNMVRYAQRQGVTARIANELPYFELFYHFYKEVRTKRQTQYIGYDELRAKFEAFPTQNLADLWVAFLGERPLSYAFIWKYKQHINFVYGSSDPEGLPFKPNNLLQWELIRYYKQHGYTLYNMWGIRNMNLSENPSFQPKQEIEGYGKFKLSFGPEVKELVRYVRI
jgi:lipid II:glycine glycyltransferase (peptidoglycan interpeptide bridge formation enzyme)